MRAALVVLALLVAAPARADVMPSGRLSAVGGFRTGTLDSFGEAFRRGGVLYGIEAAWEPMPDGRRLSYALHWNVIFGDFGADPAAITGELDILEMALGARLRVALDDTRYSVFLGGGAALLRANTPLPPDDERSYYGGFAGVGVELLAWQRALVTVEVRGGIVPGPRSISALIGVGFGI